MRGLSAIAAAGLAMGSPFKDGGINTAHRRWFWRVRHRYTDRWWELPMWYVHRELRMKSWRRPL